MAENNVIDSLELKVRSDANSAIANLSKLQTQLRHTAKSIGSLSSSVNSLNKVDLTFRNLGKINVGGLAAAITQLERLSKIDLRNVAGKKINLDVNVTGASEATREIEAMKKAANSINPKQLSDKLIKAFNIEDKGAIRTIRQQYRNIVESLSSSGKTDIKAENTIFEQVIQHGEVAKAKLNGQMNDMEDRYRQFLSYVSKQPFFTTDMGGFFGETKGEINETLLQNGLKSYFTQNANAVRDLDGIWDELTDDVHGFSDVLSSVLSREDYLGALGSELGAAEEQSNLLAKAILSVRDALKAVQLSDVSEEQLTGNATMPYYESMAGVYRTFKENTAKAMSESVGKIPLDIVLDENSVSAQIQKMIESASKKQYDFPLHVKFERSNLRQQLSEIVKGLDVSQLGGVSENLLSVSRSFASLKTVNVKDNGISAFVNSLRKLAEVNIENIGGVSQSIVSLMSGMSGLADLDLKANGINSFVNALRKLSDVKSPGAAMAVFRGLLTLVRQMSGIREISASVNLLINSLSRLATAGNKMAVTTASLGSFGNALRSMIEDIQKLPAVDSSIIKTVDALTNLAQTGKKAGEAAKSVGDSMESLDDGAAQSAQSRLSALLSVWKSICDAFEKGASVVVRGAKRVFGQLKQLGNLSHPLKQTASSVRNMIAAMIGFRGITGLASTFKEAITLGADLTEIDHIVESVFGNMAGYVDTWAKSAITQFGIAEEEAKKYAGTLSSMFQASQIGYMDAGKMSMDLVGLAGDLSAFYNIDTETAYEKIRSGMAGMVRPLRDLGIDLTAATLEEFRLAQGIQTSYSQMSQAEKVMLRYKYLMENTRTQQGDFGEEMVA